MRVVLSTLEVAMFFWAVSYLPLADTVTFYLAGPIYVTALSVVLLGESVGWRRWTAVLVGFGGVMLAMRPTAASLTLPALIALVGSVFFSLLMITTRLLRETSNTVLIAGQIGGTLLFGAVIGAVRLGHAVAARFRAAVAVRRGVDHGARLRQPLAQAGGRSVVVPYQYTIIVWAIVLGYGVFGDVPDPFTLAGAAIIIATGSASSGASRRRASGHAAAAPPVRMRGCDLIETSPACVAVISGESERADPGVRLAVLDREAETGKRLMRGLQAVGILSDVPVAHLRGDQVVACDIVGGSA